MSVLLLPQFHIHALFHGLETLMVQSKDGRIPLIKALENNLSSDAQLEISETLKTDMNNADRLPFFKKLKAYFIAKNFTAYGNYFVKTHGATFDEVEEDGGADLVLEYLSNLQDLTTPKDIPNVKPYDLFVLLNAYCYNVDALQAYATTFNEILYILRHSVIATVKGEDLELNLKTSLKDYEVTQALHHIQIERAENASFILDLQNEILTSAGLHAQFRGVKNLPDDQAQAELHKIEILNKLVFFTTQKNIAYHTKIEDEFLRIFDPYFAPQPNNGLMSLWTAENSHALTLRSEMPEHWDYRINRPYPRITQIENRVLSVLC